ncbi:exocyst subunit [Paecilomyces lecythidis]
MSGRSGYTNGNGYGDGSRYDQGYSNGDTRRANGYGGGSGGRERRVGGYGGLSEEPQQPDYSTSPSRERNRVRAEREQRQPTSRSRTRDPNAGARRPGGRDEAGYTGRSRGEGSDGARRARGPQAIEDVLQSIQRDWDFMASDECIPVQVGLQLMDNSTLGKADREPEFLEMHKQIQKTLKAIVNEHHQGFNSSIGTYHKIQGSIQSSQTRVRTLRNSLDEAKAGLLTTKPELKGLAHSSQSYDDILQLFHQIQEIQSLPEKLEGRISDKRFLSAIDILQDALRLLRKSDFDSIGGLADLRAYFSNQEVSLADILIEELHDHLYLKSPYCQDRWKPPTIDGQSNGAASMSGANGVTTWERPVYGFLAKLDTSSPMIEDASRNPEADTFSYIQMIIEALNKMGHLDVAVDRIEQRMPVELFAVVDKTNAEVDARHPNLPRGFSSRDSISNSPAEINEERGHVLSEFLWALYAKFEAIAESHRVVHDVIRGIVEREDIPKASNLTGGFKELWKLYQSEIRSLLHDYLATDSDSSFRPTNGDSDGRRNVSNQRDKNKKMFKLSDVDQKSSDMKAEQDDLDEILRSSVPGLVTKSTQRATTTDSSQSRQGNSGTGHKLLLEPSVFNMSLLLPPSLSFIQRLKDIVPVDSDIVMSTLTSFLDDFLVNVFLPQLEEAVTDLCTLSLISADAFTEDPQWAAVSPRPVFKGTVQFMNLVKAFSKMLDTIPQDQMFTQLVISQVVTYYDKCCGWYKAIVSKISPQAPGGVRLKAAAAFAESGDIRDTVFELWQNPGDKKKELVDKEIDLMIKETNKNPLVPYDIISDPKTVVALSLLYNSMQWLASHLLKLRHVSQSESRPQSSSGRVPHSRRWTLITAMRPKRDSISQSVYLPLNPETAVAFDTTVQSLRDLATAALLTLHIDIRCGIIHMLTKAMAGPNPPPPQLRESNTPITPSPDPNAHWHHIIPNPPTSASPAVLELNSDLISFDTNVSAYMGANERWFISSGLARFIDKVFISCTRYIGAMNHNGALRLQLDVLVLQQNLKNIIVDPTGEDTERSRALEDPSQPHEVVALPRSAKFLDWFLEGAEKALDYAKEEKELFAAQGDKALAAGNGEPFSYDELKVLVDLCFSEIMKGPRGAENREDFMSAKRGIADAMLRLSEVMWDS